MLSLPRCNDGFVSAIYPYNGSFDITMPAPFRQRQTPLVTKRNPNLILIERLRLSRDCDTNAQELVEHKISIKDRTTSGDSKPQSAVLSVRFS